MILGEESPPGIEIGDILESREMEVLILTFVTKRINIAPTIVRVLLGGNPEDEFMYKLHMYKLEVYFSHSSDNLFKFSKLLSTGGKLR
jgi:hypothetical protein